MTLPIEDAEILNILINFGEENWSALKQRYEEATGEELTEEAYDAMKENLGI